MKKRCVIVSAGDFTSSDYRGFEDFNVHCKEDFIIAADGGYAYLKEMGIIPDLCIGDFDSLGFAPGDCPILRLPVEKDCTDTDAAIRQGLAAGCEEFLLFGMLGGSRLSHTLANLQSLSLLAEKHIPHGLVGSGVFVKALGEGDTAYFHENENLHVSALAITDTATVTLRGLHYSGEHLPLTNRFPLGVSNSTDGKEGYVRCENGIVLVITEQK